MSSTLTMIPLSKLQRAKDNVRKTAPATEIEALAAMIDAQGLLQNLVVAPASNGRRPDCYDVVAGGRRLRALRLLARRKRISRNFKVPCKLVEPKRASGVEVSLAENIGHAPLHPADQFEAFSRLQAGGLGAADVAARYGVTQKMVEQRLKLAAVSARLMAVYREGRMSLEQLTAFTITDDHAAQEHLWFDGPLFDRSAGGIRKALTKALVEGTDRRARYIGIEAYEAAGGVVTRDLFDEEAAYFADSQLLDRLTAEKLLAEADSIRGEGWSWVEVSPELDYEARARFGRVHPVKARLPKKERKKLEALIKRHDVLAEELEGEADEEKSAELDRLASEIDCRLKSQERWKAEDKARAGALLSLDFHGRLVIDRGLVREPEGRKTAAKTGASADGQIPRDSHSATLLAELAAHRTAALRETLAGLPDVTLTALVHSLALQTFFMTCDANCIDVRPVTTHLAPFATALGEAPAVAAWSLRHEGWAKQLPEADELWAWLAGQTQETRLALLAYLVAGTVDATWQRQVNGQADRLKQADKLAQAVRLDMARWWQPTQKSYLGRVRREHILAAVAEAKSPQAADNIARLKKSEMAARAEELLAESNWLPKNLRAEPSVPPA